MEHLNIQQSCYKMMFYGIGILFMLSTTSAAYYGRSSSQNLYNTTCKNGGSQDCKKSETYLICINDKCICSSHAKYDERDEICKIKESSKCKIQSEYFTQNQPQPCIKEAYCAYPKDRNGKDLRDAAEGTCACRKGRHPKHDGTCSSAVSNKFSLKYSFVFITASLIVLFGDGIVAR